MNILTFSTLYPNNVQERHGIFVETRLRHLTRHTDVNSIVVAPVPWFPFRSKFFGEYSKYADVKKSESRHGIKIYHPKYLVIPKIGMYLTPLFLAVTSYFAIRKLIKKGVTFDVIDAHYFYPDGVAAVVIGKILKKPVTVTARGTDLTLIPEYRIPRMMIQWVIKKSTHMMTVCEALRKELLKLGAQENKVTTLRNGVDLELFQPPNNRTKLRSDLDIKGKTIISVGHLIERKGHHLIIEALRTIPEITLLIGGDGPEEHPLKSLANNLNLGDRVSFLGPLTQLQLRDYYGACDALVLASSREGWANVLLESMACGTPVVATNIWGTPEVVQNEIVGTLVKGTSQAIAEGVNHVLKKNRDTIAIRNFAEKFSWSEISDKQYEIFCDIKNTAN
jgi:teichuronic acid biosynthesis glycosyltransferase TuaC